jgi:hypothetical protein
VCPRVVLSFKGEIAGEAELAQGVTVLGRRPDCHIVIDHPAISGRHLLFRVVGRTVYAEDLGSSNGTKVNGLVAFRRVIHHLDMLEVGLHKIHFFDGTLLPGVPHNLEGTVLTDYERTLLAAHAYPQPTPRVQRRGDSLLEGEDVATLASEAAVPAFALRVMAGDMAGQLIALARANTMIGAGGDAALVVRRGANLYLARLAGSRAPRLNQASLGPGTHPIVAGDVIDVGRSRFRVIVGSRG